MSAPKTISDLRKQRERAVRKFLHYFPGGFGGQKYFDWERGYKWNAHLQWEKELNRESFADLLRKKKYSQIAALAVKIESRTNLLFSFEKMALRDAVASPDSSKTFAFGLYNYIYGEEKMDEKFIRFLSIIGSLPRKQTRVLTWPVVTVFGFIANPTEHIFLKPIVTKTASVKYQFSFQYHSAPNWDTYCSLLNFASQLENDLSLLKPRDMIDIQSFIWVLGSGEYPDLR